MTNQIFIKKFLTKGICLFAFLLLSCFLLPQTIEAETAGQEHGKVFLWEVRSKTATV